MILKKVAAWPFTFGGRPHSGWLPTGAAMPLPTPVEHVLLDVVIESTDGGFLLSWSARPSPTSNDSRLLKAGDTWHLTLAEAEATAFEEFGIERHHWTVCGPA